MNGCAQLTFWVCDHVPSEVGDLLSSETCFDGEQGDDSIAQRMSCAFQHCEEQSDLAFAKCLGWSVARSDPVASVMR